MHESWERQEYRLQQYLQRNFNIANGIPTALEVDDEEFERPETAQSLGQIIEQVKWESTPTGEQDRQLGAHLGAGVGKEMSVTSTERYKENQGGWSRSRLSPNG